MMSLLEIIVYLVCIASDEMAKFKEEHGRGIRQVVERSLCTGCGTCTSVCKSQAITMVLNDEIGIFTPEVIDERCTECGLCYDVCPGHCVDLDRLSSEISKNAPFHSRFGGYFSISKGNSTDDDIRIASSSGGLVTSILLLALEKGWIDGALVTIMKSSSPFEPEAIVANTAEMILSAARSKYCPVPLNEALRYLIDNEGRYAVVGLPCHIHGIRKAAELIPELRERIVYHIALVCNHTPTMLATEYVLDRNRISRSDVKAIQYRGHGWPGELRVELKDGSTRAVPLESGSYWGFAFQKFFYPVRCTTCIDKTCELSDLSFMDAWLPSLANDRKGTSLVLSRTEAAQQLLENSSRTGAIELVPASEEDVEESQSLDAALRSRLAMVDLLRRKGMIVPSYGRPIPRATHLDSIKARIFYIRVHLSMYRRFQTLIAFYEIAWKFGRRIRHRMNG